MPIPSVQTNIDGIYQLRTKWSNCKRTFKQSLTVQVQLQVHVKISELYCAHTQIQVQTGANNLYPFQVSICICMCIYMCIYIKWSVCVYIYMVHILTSTKHAGVKNYATRNSTAAFRGIDHSCETSEPGARPGGSANHPMATHWIYFKGSHWWCILVMVHPWTSPQLSMIS